MFDTITRWRVVEDPGGVFRDARTKTSKHAVTAEGWVLAAQGEPEERKKFLNEIVKHCQHDVIVTEQMLRHFHFLITQIVR